MGLCLPASCWQRVDPRALVGKGGAVCEGLSTCWPLGGCTCRLRSLSGARLRSGVHLEGLGYQIVVRGRFGALSGNGYRCPCFFPISKTGQTGHYVRSITLTSSEKERSNGPSKHLYASSVGFQSLLLFCFIKCCSRVRFPLAGV